MSTENKIKFALTLLNLSCVALGASRLFDLSFSQATGVFCMTYGIWCLIRDIKNL